MNTRPEVTDAVLSTDIENNMDNVFGTLGRFKDNRNNKDAVANRK